MIIPAADLIPVAWRNGQQPGDWLRAYNPAIVRFRGRLLLAYRVDSGMRATLRRRIGLCELDENLGVIPGSVVALSDSIRNGGSRHYDPRFLVYQDRLFIHYNNNFLTRPNQLFMVELDPDGLEARSPARSVHLEGPRREIEKNWMFFDHDGELLAVYQIDPQTILRVDLAGDGPIVCRQAYETAWDVAAYAPRFGQPRGGAPPVRQGDVYVAVFHSQRQISRLRAALRYWPVTLNQALPRYVAAIERRLRRPLARVRYYGGVYAFAATPPFRPVWLASEPLLHPTAEAPYRYRRRANPAADGIVYPCGAVPEGNGHWLISYGVHDERCCLKRVRLPQLSRADLCGDAAARDN